MAFAYSNNGLSWRTVETDWPLASGEVMFDDTPTTAELKAAFPSYAAAMAQASVTAQTAAALAAGVTITGTSAPTLSGTYACTPDMIMYMNSEIGALALNGTFADGSMSIEWPDVSGALHNFTVAQFKTIAAALGVYVSGIRKYAIGAPEATLPVSVVTIA